MDYLYKSLMKLPKKKTKQLSKQFNALQVVAIYNLEARFMNQRSVMNAIPASAFASHRPKRRHRVKQLSPVKPIDIPASADVTQHAGLSRVQSPQGVIFSNVQCLDDGTTNYLSSHSKSRHEDYPINEPRRKASRKRRI